MSEVAPDSAPATAALAEGVVIGGKYRLVGELGVGAMGTVWSATHQTLGHQVAIKFLLRSIMASEEARGRFDREARLAARLGEASRHITRVIDHGVTDDRVPYLVMELLRGEALSTHLKRERRIPLPLAARIVQQLSRALHVAHSAGVIHRDLKPANIFLCTPEQGDEVDVKLLDFGIAKATADSDDETTGQGQILGTPSYMSPEQILNDKPVDVRADLWAVAAIVYRMVVGRAPFGGGAIQEIGMRVMSVEPVPPSQIWNDLPRELDSWIERGLAKKPEERFTSARELSDFLSAVAGTNSMHTVAGMSAAAVQQKILEGGSDDSSQSLRTTNGSQVRSRPPPPMRPRRRLLVPLIAGGVLLAIVVFFVTRRGTQTVEGVDSAAAAPSPSHVDLAAVTSSPSSPSPSIVASAAPTPAKSVAPKASGTAAGLKGVKPKHVDGSGWGNKKEL